MTVVCLPLKVSLKLLEDESKAIDSVNIKDNDTILIEGELVANHVMTSHDISQKQRCEFITGK